MTMIMPLLAFLFGSAIVAGLAYALMPGRAVAIDRRLEELTLDRQIDEKPRFQRILGVLKRVGDSAPKNPKELGALRLRLVQAGFRRDEALTLFFGIRIVFALLLFALLSSSIITRPNLLYALGGLWLGYILPGMVLARMARLRSACSRSAPARSSRFTRRSSSDSTGLLSCISSATRMRADSVPRPASTHTVMRSSASGKASKISRWRAVTRRESQTLGA